MISGPFEREAPTEVVAHLRGVHPRAELLYFGDGVWGVGVVDPSDARRRQADRILRGLYGGKPVKRGSPAWVERSKQYLWALALKQGFAQTAHYVLSGEPTSAIVEDFRTRRYAYENHVPYDEWKATRDAHKEEKEFHLDPARFREASRLFRERRSLHVNRTHPTA